MSARFVFRAAWFMHPTAFGRQQHDRETLPDTLKNISDFPDLIDRLLMAAHDIALAHDSSAIHRFC
jgi:hypothetical protein